MAIIQITSRRDLTHLWVKCDTTARAAAYYFDILPSGSVPVTQRWTSPLILIKLPTHQDGLQIKLYLRDMKKKSAFWIASRLSHTVYKSASIVRSVLTTILCAQNTYFGSTNKKYPQLSLSPASCPFLRTLKSHNPFPFSSHSVPPQKAPDSFGPYQFQWRENKGVCWNSYSASLKGKLGRVRYCGTVYVRG